MRTRLPILAGALLLVLAACGGDTSATTAPTLPTLSDETADASTAATTTTEAVDPEEAFQEWGQCMRDQGIELDDPVYEGGGTSSMALDRDMDFDAFEEAAAACDPIIEGTWSEFEMSPEQEAEMMDRELAIAQCMRDNGIDWPDPSGDPVAIELGDDVDPETVEAAMEVCMKDAFGDTAGSVIGGETP